MILTDMWSKFDRGHKIITGSAAILVLIIGAWVKMDIPYPVTNKYVSGQLSLTKTELIEQLKNVQRSARINRKEMLDARIQLISLHKSTLTGQLLDLQALLTERPHDLFLLQRKAELDDQLAFLAIERTRLQEEARKIADE